RPLAAIALAGVSGLVFTSLTPFDLSLDMGDVRAAVKQARPIPFGPPVRGPWPPPEPWSWAVETLSWTLVGGTLALALREAGRPSGRVVVEAAALGGLIGAAVEVTQFAIRSRTADATSVACAVAGAALGAA